VFFIYQWLIAFPVLLVLTILTAILTTILSPLFPNNTFSYYPARWWGKAFCFLLFVRVKIYGLENIDSKQSYVLTCNHQSIFDIFVVYGWLPFIFKWIMKIELRQIPLVGKACESAGHIFIDRSNPIAAKKSLENAELQLKNGVSVVIFPEGTRTKTGELGPFKKGAFRLATDLKLPIVPVTIRGSFERLHRNSLHVHPGKIELTIHKPIDATSFNTDQINEIIQKTKDQIQSAL
jgi:1-acyl-sn-glycerol-3-phosphate acyltransferase